MDSISHRRPTAVDCVQHEHSRSVPHPHQHPDSDADSHPDEHADGDVHVRRSNADANQHSDEHSDQYGHAHGHTDADPYKHPHGHAYGNSDGDLDGYPDRHAHADANIDADRYLHARGANHYPDEHTDGDPDSDGDEHSDVDSVSHRAARAADCVPDDYADVDSRSHSDGRVCGARRTDPRKHEHADLDLDARRHADACHDGDADSHVHPGWHVHTDAYADADPDDHADGSNRAGEEGAGAVAWPTYRQRHLGDAVMMVRRNAVAVAVALLALVALTAPAMAQAPYDLKGCVEGSVSYIDIQFTDERGNAEDPDEITYFVTTSSTHGATFLYGPTTCHPSPTPSVPTGACAGNIPASDVASAMTIRLPADACRITDTTKNVETGAVGIQWKKGTNYRVARGTFPIKAANVIVVGTPGAMGPTPEPTSTP